MYGWVYVHSVRVIVIKKIKNYNTVPRPKSQEEGDLCCWLVGFA